MYLSFTLLYFAVFFAENCEDRKSLKGDGQKKTMRDGLKIERKEFGFLEGVSNLSRK